MLSSVIMHNCNIEWNICNMCVYIYIYTHHTYIFFRKRQILFLVFFYFYFIPYFFVIYTMYYIYYSLALCIPFITLVPLLSLQKYKFLLSIYVCIHRSVYDLRRHTHTPIHVYTFRARTPFVSRPGNSASHFTPEPLLIHHLTNELLYIVLSLLLTDRATGRTPIQMFRHHICTQDIPHSSQLM